LFVALKESRRLTGMTERDIALRLGFVVLPVSCPNFEESLACQARCRSMLISFGFLLEDEVKQPVLTMVSVDELFIL
jgi:hypothetical protein